MFLIDCGWFLAPEPVRKNVAFTLLADKVWRILLMLVPSDPSSNVNATTLLVVAPFVTYLELAASVCGEKENMENKTSKMTAATLNILLLTRLTPFSLPSIKN